MFLLMLAKSIFHLLNVGESYLSCLHEVGHYWLGLPTEPRQHLINQFPSRVVTAACGLENGGIADFFE